MKFSAILCLPAAACALLSSCDQPSAAAVPGGLATPAQTAPSAPSVDPMKSVLRLRTTMQNFNPGQPWEKNPPVSRRGLGAYLAGGMVITTADMVADSTFLELESPDGTRSAPARIVAVDYEANLALVAPAASAPSAPDAAPGAPDTHPIFTGMAPLAIGEAPALGDTLDILQIEENGVPLVTRGQLQSVDIVSTFLPDNFFLTFRVKASMQSAASSYTLPVVKGGRLVGVLTSYNSGEQISDVTSTDVLSHFVREAADGKYSGFPSLGLSAVRTDDSNFRKWLKIPAGDGGLYVAKVRPQSAAMLAGVKEGDVLLAIDQHALDRRGYYEDSRYGRIFWSHLVRGLRSTGDTVKLSLLRAGEPIEANAVLVRDEEGAGLIPKHSYDLPPNYLVKGGMVFQELTRGLLEAYGKEWTLRAPMNLLNALENPEEFEEGRRRLVVLTGIIPTPATVGYEEVRNLIVNEVNGQKIKDVASLLSAFRSVAPGGNHHIKFDEAPYEIYLDSAASDTVDKELRQRGLAELSRTSAQ
jgi:S1-C subfamily serine protease